MSTNALIHETSPYLLQHAHNPVEWYPWNKESLQKAKDENKLIIISIGYSACHWCHVMERESFEDAEVAKLMNERFINIKVDREERPDIDQIYMTAVQLMNQGGGWPLNCIALPNGKPVWGGTYFTKHQWLEQIKEVANFHEQNSQKMKEYAERLAQGIQQSELVSYNKLKPSFKWSQLDGLYKSWKNQFDYNYGGFNSAPKFPLPNNQLFLLRYAELANKEKLHDYVQLTLNEMAYGGIYDQIGGGFARYSTDILWKVPHFEKMLYDNAQLVSLYSEAFTAYGNPFYQEVVEETLAFIERELSHKNGAFYSAIDADSEGEEGKFYVWKKKELKALLGEDYMLFCDYYNVNNKGLWEHDNYILLRNQSDIIFCQNNKLDLNSLQKLKISWRSKLLNQRDQRIRPSLDDKSLTSWNALMCKGYVDAYLSFGKEKYLKKGLKNAQFIIEKQWQKNGALWHSFKNNRSTINGYLDDYAFTIEAFISIYQATFNEEWIARAEKLTHYCIKHFYDSTSGMFFFTSNLDVPLIARKMEINDNVIPSSNSCMANNLFSLGVILDKEEYLNMAEVQLNNIKGDMPNYPSGYSNWANLMLKKVAPFYEVAIVGKKANEKTIKLNQEYYPNKIFLGATHSSSIPLLKNKMVMGQTTIYVCQNKSCKLPTTDIKKAQNLMQ